LARGARQRQASRIVRRLDCQGGGENFFSMKERHRRLPLKVSNGPGRAKNEGRCALVNGHRQPERSGPKSANCSHRSGLESLIPTFRGERFV
jgi:hypothetical protein